MLHPTPAVDPDAKGKIEFEFEFEFEIERENCINQEFEIEFVDTVASTYTLWIEDGVAA